MGTSIQEVSTAYAAWKPYLTGGIGSADANKAAYQYGKLASEVTLSMVGVEGFSVGEGQTLVVMDNDDGILRLSGPRKYNLSPIEGFTFVVVARNSHKSTYTVVDGKAVPAGS